MGGALDNPANQAMLRLQGDSDPAAKAFAQADPYVKAGLVTGWTVRPWNTVVGTMASAPLHPQA